MVKVLFKNPFFFLHHFSSSTFSERRGEELERDTDGAVKHSERLSKSGYGYNILIDEIVFDYFSKLKDEEKQPEREKKSDIFQRERAKRNLLMFEKFLKVSQCFLSYLTLRSVFTINKHRTKVKPLMEYSARLIFFLFGISLVC